MPFAALVAMLAAHMPATPRAHYKPAMPRVHSAVHRSSVLRCAEEPFRSDEKYDYFKRLKDVHDIRATRDALIPVSVLGAPLKPLHRVLQVDMTLPKPIGAVLESAAGSGVVVTDLAAEGSAQSSGLLKKGDRIYTVMGADVSSASFEEVMERLKSAPSEVELGVKRAVLTKKERVPAAGAAGGLGEAPQSKMDKKFDQNFGSAEKTAKTLTKVAKITTATATWKNPVYFWSVAGTALLFVPIILYSVSK